METGIKGNSKLGVFITPGLFQGIVVRTRGKNCFLVYWTIHESMVLEAYLEPETYTRLTPRLFNLHPMARKYANRRRLFGHQSSTRGRPLEDFLAALYKKRNPYPPFPLGAAEACRRIDVATRKKKRWKSLSDLQKSYVKDLVQYNTGDCRSTWLVAKRLGNVHAKTTGALTDSLSI